MHDKSFRKSFLVVVPNEDCIINDDQVNSYIYKYIVSKPCPELIQEIKSIISSTVIFGILSRGSLANYIYSQDLGIPLYLLEFTTMDIFRSIDRLSADGYSRIGIIEVASGSRPRENLVPNRTKMAVKDNLFVYNRIYNSDSIQDVINGALDDGIDYIIGDLEPILMAEQTGIPNEIVPVTADSYKNTISHAILATTSDLVESSMNSFITDITNIVSECVVICDDSGSILRSNNAFKKEFDGHKNVRSIQEIAGSSIEKMIYMQANSILDIGGKQYVCNVISLQKEEDTQYAVIFQSVTDIENIEMSIRRNRRKEGFTAKNNFDDMVKEDTATQQLVKKAKRYARSNGTIMILGESGTGKEIFASSIHNASLRASGPFVAINCATFVDSLIESELFGYEKGAFTGALTTGKKGLFELAHGGTLFLDEVVDLPLSVQSKLLRVLEEKEVRRIGGEVNIPIDVRILVASNKSLCSQVEAGKFREDLYYRLNVLELLIPPLRLRKGDIIPLFKHFLIEYSTAQRTPIYWTDDGIFQSLYSYNWPGNVRELRNFAERIVLLAPTYKITASYIESNVSQLFTTGPFKERSMSSKEELSKFSASDSASNEWRCKRKSDQPESIKKQTDDYVRSVLDSFGGDKKKTCEALGISRTTLWRRLNGK